MSTQHGNPGVSIVEQPSPPPIVGVDTAVPVFIGYTEKAEQAGRPMRLQPVLIGSLLEYQAIFGGAFVHRFTLADASAGAGTPQYDVALGNKYYRLDLTKRLYLYNSLRLFYANGGGSCYVVSVGTYDAAKIAQTELLAGLAAVQDLAGPTILAIPEATLLYEPSLHTGQGAACAAMARQMMRQCADRQDRVALLDVWGAEALPLTATRAELDPVIAAFRDGVAGTPEAANALQYGMTYFPFLKTSIVNPSDAGELSYANFNAGSLSALWTALTEYAKINPRDAGNKDYLDALEQVAKLPPGTPVDPKLAATLTANTPGAVKTMYAVMAEKIGILPPSAAMAGVYAMNDATRGVWNAPANVGLRAVNGPAVNISNDMQSDLNIPLGGLAVNAIRDFPGQVAVVWGTRTLDGNSNDWRYIQVRRTAIYIEQSIKLALANVVFEPNTAPTWTTVKAMIANFLTLLWKDGGLVGSTPQQSYSVQCGLGSTMTAQDIFDGKMIVTIMFAITHPAEFIVLTLTQKMQGSAG